MSQLYSVSDEDFAAWIESGPSEGELREAYIMVEGKLEALWTPGFEDSFYRDRYERDARYIARLKMIKQSLANIWIDSGQVKVA